MTSSDFPVSSDTAAVDIIMRSTEGEGAVMFKGWLLKPSEAGGGTDTPPGRVRFFTDPQFLDWLEIPADDIVYQTKADADDPEGGSVIWVKREARIRRCEAGRAYWFEQRKADMADDPTARWPRPPH